MADAIWIGFLVVRPIAGADPFDGAPGAYVHAAVEASDRARFEERVRGAAHERVTVVEIEDVSPALAGGGVRALSGDQRRLISHARGSNDVAWGTFHAYEQDDDWSAGGGVRAARRTGPTDEPEAFRRGTDVSDIGQTRAVRARGSLVVALAALTIGACGQEHTASDGAAPTVTTAPLTRIISPRLRRVCASAARKGTIPVRCPRLIPAGTVRSSVLLPRRSVVRPGAAGDDGRLRFRVPRDFYVIDAYARSLRPERHWLIAAGSARSLEERALRSARPPRVERVRAGGREIELRRYPPYPDGGVNGGHVVAIARVADQLTYVSVHGHENADVAIAMLLDLLADR